MLDWFDTVSRVFCYVHGELRMDVQNDEVLRFVDDWKQRTGGLPEGRIFDSKLTTYANLGKLNRMGIPFITLRRRTKELLDAIAQAPASAWRRIEGRNSGEYACMNAPRGFMRDNPTRKDRARRP